MPVSDELAKEIEEAAEQVVTEAKEQAEGEQEAGTAETTAVQTSTGETVVDTPEVDSTTDAPMDSKGDAEQVETSENQDDESSSAPIGEQKDDEPSVPDLSDEIIARGFGAGMALNDILSFPDEASLDRVVSAIEHRRQVESKVVQPETADNVIPEDPFADLKLDPDKYEPEMVEMMSKLKGVLTDQHEQIQAFRREQEQVSLATQAAARQETTQWFDKEIEGLGDDFADALGTGKYDSLDRGSSQFAKREEIAEQMVTLKAGYDARSIEAPPRDELFNTAARLVLADEFQAAHEKRLAGKLAKRSTQHIQRASGTKARTTLTPEQDAANAVDEFLGNR